MKKRSLTHISVSLAGLAFASLAYCPAAHAQNLIPNPGFESGTAGWGLLVPKESEGKAQPLQLSQTEVHSGTAAVAINVTGGARVGIGTKTIQVKQGDRYRLTAWVKFGDNVQFKPGTPGAYFRATLLQGEGKDIKDIDDPQKHMQIGLQGTMARSTQIIKLAVNELPKEWTKLEGVIEIPATTTYITPNFFVEGVTGTVFIDDLGMELVPASTPLSRAAQ